MNKLVESEAFIDPIKIEGTELKNYFLLSVLPCRRKDGMLSCFLTFQKLCLFYKHRGEKKSINIKNIKTINK